QVYRWIERHSGDAAARLSAITLDNRRVELRLGDLDLGERIEAYAYTSEKVFYLRTNLVENFPLAALEIMNSKQENVPDIADGFVERYRATLENIISDLKAVHGERRDWLDGRSDHDLEETAGRLIAFDNARSSLEEEFELFRVMYNAARTYDLNTTLERDPRVRDKRQAVERTLGLIARTLDEEPWGIRLTIDNYSDFLGSGFRPSS